MSWRGLELNAGKTKLMVFKKSNKGRKKNVELSWGNEKIEVVQEFVYLGYTMTPDNGDSRHVRRLAGKARSVMGRVWGIGERNFEDNWHLRMGLFDALVVSVKQYGAEIWGWEAREELEKVQNRFIKWTLKINNTTPEYVLLNETGRDKIELRSAARALKYDWKLSREEDGSMLKRMWEVRTRDVKKVYRKEKECWLRERGWSWKEYQGRMRRGEPTWEGLR